jgi:hypothetical protein
MLGIRLRVSHNNQLICRSPRPSEVFDSCPSSLIPLYTCLLIERLDAAASASDATAHESIVLVELLEALSLTGAKEWLTAMPYEHDLRIPPHLMKWALATYLQAPTPVAAVVGLQSLRAGGNGVMGLACHAMSHWFETQARCSESRCQPTFWCGWSIEVHRAGWVLAGVQDEHERPDHCLQDLFTYTSMLFAVDRHVRVVVGERERVKVNKYGEKCRRAGAFFQPLVLEARSGGMSKTTANIIKKHAMLAGHRMGSDPMFLHRRWFQNLSIKVQVLNTNLVETCMPYGDAYCCLFPAVGIL